MPNLFDDVPTLTPPDNLFSDVPTSDNLFDDVPIKRTRQFVDPESALPDKLFVPEPPQRPGVSTSGPLRQPMWIPPEAPSDDALLRQITTPPPQPTENDLLRKQMAEERMAQADSGARGFSDLGKELKPVELVPFARQGYDIGKAGILYNAAKRYSEKPVDGGEDEKVLLEYAKEQRESQAPETIGHAVGNILLRLPAFAVELASTAGIYSGAKKLTEKTLLKAATKFIDDAAEKAATRVATRVAGTVAGSAAQAPVAQGLQMVAGTIERMTPGVSVEDGKLKLDPTKADPLLMAGAKSFGNEFVEVFSEHTGGAFASMLNKVPGVMRVRALKAALVNRWLKLHPGSTVEQALKRLSTEAAWDGAIPEMLEERLGEALKPALGIEEEYHPPSLQQLMAEGLAFMVPGAAAGAIRTGSAVRQGQARKSRMEELRGYRGTAARAQEIESVSKFREDAKTAQDITDLIINEGAKNAQRVSQAEPVYEDVQRPTVTPEGAGQVSPVEGSAGVPASGQAAVPAEAQAVAAAANLPTEALQGPTAVPEAKPLSEPAPTVQTLPTGPTAQGQGIPETPVAIPPAPRVPLEDRETHRRLTSVSDQANRRPYTPLEPQEFADLSRSVRDEDLADADIADQVADTAFAIREGQPIQPGTPPHIIEAARQKLATEAQPSAPVLEPPAPAPATKPTEPPPTPPKRPTAPPTAPPADELEARQGTSRGEKLRGTSELTTLLQRREAIKAKLLSNPTQPLPAVELEELNRISDRIHQLDPNRRGPVPVEDQPLPTRPETVPQPTATSVAPTAPARPKVPSRFQSVIDAAEVKLQSLLQKLGLPSQGVTVEPSVEASGIATVNGAIATVTADGRIVIFKDAMDKALARFKNASDRRRFIDQVLAEEAFHAFIDKALTQQEVEAVWASLTPEQQAELLSIYAPGVKVSELSPYQLGHEYLRQFLQRKTFGTRTESVRPDSTLFDRWTEALRAVVAKILSALKLAGETGNATFDAATRKLEKALGQSVTGPAKKATGQQRPAALVTDSSRRQDELVASSEIPQEQIDFVNQSVFSQNYATAGHMESSFRALTPEVQAFLPTIRSRYPAMYDGKAALGARAVQGDLPTMIRAITSDPKEQSLLYADAWQNVAEILAGRAKLAADIDKTRNELEAASKLGGTQTNPTQTLISAAAWHEINNLIVQRNAVIAAQGHPGSLNQRIADLKQWMHETVFFRVATAIAAGQPLNYQAIGVDPVKGAIVAQVLQNYPGLAAGVQRIQTTPQTNQQVLDLQAKQQQQEQALAWTDQLMASPEFRFNYESSRKAVGAELKMVSETEAEVKFLDPITGEQVSVVFSSEAGVIGDGQNKLVAWLKNAHAYLALPDTQRDPLTEAGVRNTMRVIEEVYLNPSYTPDPTGKIYVGTDTGRKFDLFNLLTIGGNISTPEARLERIGGVEAAIAQMRGQAYGMVGQQLRTTYERMRNAAYIAVKKAVQSHKKDSRPITSDKQWIEEISNPIFASWQEQGSRHLKVGSKHLGRTINATDMAAIEAQKKLTDAMARLPSNVQTTMTRLFPLKIKEDGLITYFRDPQATGLYTMPRYATEQATTYAQEWLKIAENKDASARRRAFEAYLGGKANTQAFIDLVIGHMRSATDVPTYARFISTTFLDQYRSLARDYHEGNSTAPNSVTEVLDRIFQGQTVPQEKLMDRDGIADSFFAELTKAFNAFGAAKLVENAQNAPRSDVKVTSADNFLTTPRGEQVLPSSLYEYSVADRNQHSRAMNAVLEVLGQRFVESLQATARTIQVQITKFNDRVAELQRQGVEFSKAKDQVQAESRQAHLDGLNWFDYNESVYQLGQINKSIEEMRQIAANERALENRELRTGTHIFRSFFGGPLLETIGVVWRNFVGGPLKMIQRDAMMSKSIRIFRSFDGGISIPGGNLIAAPIKRFGTVVKTVATGGVLPSFLASKFFEGKKGQAIRAQLNANPQAFSLFSKVVYEWANDQAKRYDQLRELGLAGSGNVAEQIQAYVMMFTSGGQIRPEGGSFGGAVQSFLGIVSETGLPGGHPGIPRNAFSRWADLSVNEVVGGELTRALARLEEDALLYLSRRRGLGHTSTQMLTPEELVGNRYATRKEATYLRNQWQKAGLNIDRKMLKYFDKVQAAKNAGQPFDNIRLLDETERNSLFMVYAGEINKGSFMNRPAWLSTTEMGRNFGMFKGYGLWDNSRVRYALSRFSQSKDKTNAEGVSTIMVWLFYIGLAALLGESINKLLSLWLYNEERQTPNPFKAESPLEAAKAMATWMAPFQPMVGGVFNTLFTGVSKDGKVSMDFIPTSALSSMLNTMRAINQTGDAVRPVTSFVRQWFPNTRIALNRLPYNEGLTEYYNVNRSLRANTPGDIEVRQATGGSYRFSATSDNVANVVNALNRPNGPDWELAMRERALGIEEKRRHGSAQPERAFDASVKAKSPMSAVYGRRLTEDETGRIESRLSEPQLSRLRRVNSGFTEYARRTGSSSTRRRGRARIATGRRPRSLGRLRGVGRLRSTGRLRRTGRLRGLRQRSLRSSLR